jgi:hypothetical protein
MPKWLFICLCLAYVIPGYVGRDAWKSADIASFGVMQALALGQSDWWTPTVLDMPASTVAWLPYWLGALCMAALPDAPELGSRLPYASALLLTLYFTWKSAHQLASLRAAQPVAFAFGGQAEPTAYARALADAGLLAILACLGLAQISHETSPHVFQTAAMAALLYTSAQIADPARRSTSVALGGWAGLGVLALSGQPMLAAAVACLQAAQYIGIHRRHAAVGAAMDAKNLANRSTALLGTGTRSPTHGTWSVHASLWAGSMVFGLGYCLLALTHGPIWELQIAKTASEWWSLLKLLTWFTWPLWPLACWTLWRWRQHVHQPHLLLPLALVAATLLNSVTQAESNRLLMLSLPALSALAALSMPTLGRSVGALIDWFSVLFFSACAIVIWVVWIAMHTGVPATPAANVAKLAPDFSPTFSLPTLVIAAVATIAWCLGIAWRIGRHPPYLWKSLLLPAGGSVLCWLLLMTLWLPLLDHGRSYRTLAERLGTHLGSGQCAYAPDLSLAQSIGLMHYGGMDLERDQAKRHCAYLILQDPSERAVQGLQDTTWLLKARFNRLNERQEALLLFAEIKNRPEPVATLEPDRPEATD